MVEPNGTLLWTSSLGLRCVVVPFFGQCQLRLLRDVDTVRTEVFTDEADALTTAKRWRRLYARRSTRVDQRDRYQRVRDAHPHRSQSEIRLQLPRLLDQLLALIDVL